MKKRNQVLWNGMTFLAWIWVGVFPQSRGWALTEFVQVTEKDFSLRSMGPLQITNAKGDISIQGWSQDRLRIKFIKKVQAETEAAAAPLFNRIQYRFEVKDGNIEISNQYGESLSIEEALKERENHGVRADMVIFAPANLKLSLWSVKGKISLKGWNSALAVRSHDGPLQVENVKSESVSVDCMTCAISLKDIRSNLRVKSNSGSIYAENITGKDLFFATDSGAIRTVRIAGAQIYVAKEGQIDGQELDGKIEFHTEGGNVALKQSSGFLSGNTESGNILAQMVSWKPSDKALIESISGNIDLTLPFSFSADVDLETATGKIQVGFPLILQRDGLQKQTSTQKILGKIGDGGEYLRVDTKSGSIRLESEKNKMKFF